ncbi:MAG: cytochrome bc complex cytochrome b subunit, partial [Desulfobacterales bacterium]
FTHTFHLGFFTVFFFFVEIISGLILMLYYVPTPQDAYGSILRLISEVPFGDLLRDIHRLGGEAMIVFAALHLLRTFLTGAYQDKRRFTWVLGVAMLIITLGLAFSGYLLPWDQLAYWAVTIGTSMAEATPLIGRPFNLILRGGIDIGADGLLRFYLLHVFLLPVLGLLLLGAHYYRVSRVHGISLPVRIESGHMPETVKKKAEQPVDFIPHVFTHELFLICLGLFFLVLISLYFYDAPLEHHADPRQTPLDTQAPWFFLWIQGMLKLGDKTLMGVIVPALFFVGLFAVPYLDRSPRRILTKRPVSMIICAGTVISLIILSAVGTHHYGINLPPGDRILQDLAPEEGIGPLRSVPNDQLTVGIYPMAETDVHSLQPALAAVFSKFKARLEDAERFGGLEDADGIMMIEDWQADLKRVTLRIVWTDRVDGKRKTKERIVHLHRNRKGQPG